MSHFVIPRRMQTCQSLRCEGRENEGLGCSYWNFTCHRDILSKINVEKNQLSLEEQTGYFPNEKCGRFA